MRIASGAADGLYHRLANELASLADDPEAFEILQTQGSRDNLERLCGTATPNADIGFVQSDMLVDTLDRICGDSQLQVIMALHPETLQWVARPDDDLLFVVEDLWADSDSIRVSGDGTVVEFLRPSASPFRAWIGPPCSGTREAAMSMLRAQRPGLQGLEPGQSHVPCRVPRVDVTVSSAIAALRESEPDRLDAVAAVGGVPLPSIQAALARGAAKLLGVADPSWIDRMPGYTARTVIHPYGSVRSELFPSAQAMLVARADVPEEVVRSLLETYTGHQRDFAAHFQDVPDLRAIRLQDLDLDRSTGLHMCDRGRVGLAPHPALCAYSASYRFGRPHGPIIAALLVLLTAFMALMVIHATAAPGAVEAWLHRAFRGQRRIQLSVLTMTCMLLALCGVGVQFYEQRYAVLHGSDFAGRSFGQTVQWLLFFSTLGVDQSTFPSSLGARVLALVSHASVLASIAVVAGGLLLSRVAKMVGFVSKNIPGAMRQHVVVVGWNRRAMDVVTHLGRTTRADSIVLLADLTEEQLKEIQRRVGAEVVVVQLGEDLDGGFRSVRVDRAESVVLLGPESDDPDPVTLYRALRLTRFVADARVERPPHVVAELRDAKNRELAWANGVDEIVSATGLIEGLVTGTVQVRGYSTLVDHLLPVPGRDAGVRLVECSQWTAHAGRTFDELLAEYRRFDAMPLGFRLYGLHEPVASAVEGLADRLGSLLRDLREMGPAGLGADDRRFRQVVDDCAESLADLREHGATMERMVIFNPSGQWRIYRTDPEDGVYVFCPDSDLFERLKAESFPGDLR